jgi:hypothetical protein
VTVWETIGQLVQNLGTLAIELLFLVVRYGLLIAWVAWWLVGVNWQKAWAYLRAGAWAPVVLLTVVAALAWSRLNPSDCPCLGLFTIPNFWWQLLGVSLLVGFTLFLGWLQGLLGWTPEEINLEPPAAAAHDHGHGNH